MKRLAILFIVVVVVPPVVRGEQSPSPGTGGVSAHGAVLARDVIVPLAVVTRFFPEATQEMSTGQNETAVRNPEATRSVIYTNSDKSKKVTISVDQYATSSDALAAYEEAVQKSRSVPGFRSIDAPNLGPKAFIGTVTQGTERHIGLGALGGTLIVGVTLVGYEANADTTAKLVSLAREEEKAAAAIVGAISRAVKEKLMHLFRLSLLSVSRPASLLRFQRTAERMPMKSVTRCPIASVSKHFVSAGAYLLQQKRCAVSGCPSPVRRLTETPLQTRVHN